MDRTEYFLDRNVFYRDDELIRIEWHSGTIEFFYTGKVHKVMYPTGITYWFKDEKFHRLDGPAIFNRGTGRKQWYIEGEEYTEDQYRIITFTLHKEPQNCY